MQALSSPPQSPIKVDEPDTDERMLNLQTSNNLARTFIEEEYAEGVYTLHNRYHTNLHTKEICSTNDEPINHLRCTDSSVIYEAKAC